MHQTTEFECQICFFFNILNGLHELYFHLSPHAIHELMNNSADLHLKAGHFSSSLAWSERQKTHKTPRHPVIFTTVNLPSNQCVKLTLVVRLKVTTWGEPGT